MSAAPSPAELALLAEARDLARRGEGAVSPNPPVGAIVVREGRVIARGWHRGPGRPHAEAEALAAATEDVRGATVVCTLEPCSHQGRTPPCSAALIAAGVTRVVIGATDPLERGSERRGGGEALRAAGIDVACAGDEDAELCRELAGAFFTHAISGRPLVTLKLATSLDGRIATASGESQWITGPPARRLVHRWRADSDAIAVGIGTALADDPRLSARDVDGEVRQPRPLVFDSGARLPADGALAEAARERGLLVVTAPGADPGRVAELERAGAEILAFAGSPEDRIHATLDLLGRRGVQSLFVEGGAGLAAAMIAAEAVDRVRWFLAPILIGGRGAPGALADPGTDRLDAAPRLAGASAEWVGDDLLMSGRLRAPAWRE